MIGGRGWVGGSDAQRGAEQWQSSGKPGQDQRCLHQAGAGRVASGSREAQAPRRTRRRHVRLAQDWLSSRAGPALGGSGRKAGSGDGPAGRPAAFGWLALQGGPGASAPRALILCLSGFRARRCFWHLKSGRQGDDPRHIKKARRIGESPQTRESGHTHSDCSLETVSKEQH